MPANCIGNVVENNLVTVTASPSSDFEKWSGGSIPCSTTSSTCSFKIIKDESFNANFASTFSLTVTTSGTGSGPNTFCTGPRVPSSCIGTNSLLSGTEVRVIAGPASGSTFTGWSGACSGTD